jgi:hypothetical protein
MEGDTTDPTAQHPGAPRWVKIVGAAALGLILIVVVLLAAGHGPGRHFGGQDKTPGTGASPHQPPEGGH